MLSIIRLIVMILVIALMVAFVYYIVYSRHINAKIASGEIKGRRMVGIPDAMRVVIIVALLVYATIVTSALNKSSKQVIEENHNTFSVISLADYTYRSSLGIINNNDASFAKAYSKEENDGYKKSVTRDGDFVYTSFTRTGKQDDFHPDFFCFVDYIGENSNDLSLYEYYEYLETETQTSGGGIGTGGGGIEDSFLIIGNANEENSFKITLSILDSDGEDAYMEADHKAYEADKGDFPAPSDYALSSSSVVITVK